MSSILDGGFDELPEASLGPLLYPLYFEHFGVMVKSASEGCITDA